jgi:hypothetical protein
LRVAVIIAAASSALYAGDVPLARRRAEGALQDPDAPLGLLGKSLLFTMLAVAHDLGKTIPDIKPDDTITGAQGLAIGHEVLGDLYPAMRDQAGHQADPL